MTEKLVYEETPEDWDERFVTNDWGNAGGNFQSLQFMYTLLQHLTFPESWNIAQKNQATGQLEGFYATIRDYGCALGDGTALLKTRFPLAKVIGVDHSPKGIEMARKRWPTIDFEVGDIREPTMSDVIFTSHTLEHMEQPDAVVRKLMQNCTVLIAVFPWITAEHNGDHKGAALTEEWLRRLPPPMIQTKFATVRKDTEKEDRIYVEASHVAIWKTLI